MKTNIEMAADAIRAADGILISAGAGMSIDSGLPDFRGGQGLWTAYPKLAHLNISFIDMCNPKAFKENPELCWGWYGHRIKDYRRAIPHQGFKMLQKIAKLPSNGHYVFTSNVDGHFQKSGFDPSRIVECHGTVHKLQCTRNCKLDTWTADDLEPVVDLYECRWMGELPTCPHCGMLARPNVMMFSDLYYARTESELAHAACQEWMNTCKNIVGIEIGAGNAVPTVRWYNQDFTTTLIRINPTDYDSPREQDIGIPLGGLDGITALYAALGLDKDTYDGVLA